MTKEEAIEVVKKNWPDGRYQLQDALRKLIPELAESDFDSMKKKCISLIFYVLSC